MSKTAGFLCWRQVGSALSIVSIGAGLGACAHAPSQDHGEAKQWAVQSVGAKSTAELYADLIAPGTFQRSSSKVVNGYTVESGSLSMPDKSDGSLVTVRGADGSLTAIVDRQGRQGTLFVSSQGAARFVPEPDFDANIDDAVVNPNEKIGTAATVDNAEPKVIDLLMGYSQAGVDRMGGDVNADALAKVELVNLALRNSLVSGVSFRLVGIEVIPQDHPITPETVNKLASLFADGIAKYEPDLIYGNFAQIVGGGVGYGHMPGRLAIGVSDAPLTFAHELGHNAGSHHCNDGTASYRFGYDNGKSSSLLCGWNRKLYFSNPDVKDEFGLPRGNAVTADTARVWRENAERMSAYAHFVPKVPGRFTFTSSSYGSVAFRWQQSPRAVKYEVMGKDNVLQPYKKLGESTTPDAVLHNVASASMPYYVVAVFADGSKSGPSNIAYAKPYESLTKK